MADDYEQLAYDCISTGASELELANSELELADSCADSSSDPVKVSVWPLDTICNDETFAIAVRQYSWDKKLHAQCPTPL